MRVPVYERQVDPVAPPPARADLTGIGIGGGLKAVGRALEESADVWYRVSVRRQEADRTITAINTQTAAMRELDDVETAYAESPDYAGAEEQYRKKAGEIVDGYGKRFDGDPRRGAEFQQTMQRLTEAGALKLRQRAIGKRADAATAALDDSIATALQTRAKGNKVQREEVDRGVYAGIQAAVDAGLITAEDGGKRVRDYDSGGSEADVLTAIRTDPHAALLALQDPGQYAGLSPVARERQLRAAQSRVDSLAAEDERQHQAAERAAEKALRRREDETAREMFGRAADGKLDRGWLDKNKPHLSPSEFRTGLELLKPRDSEADDRDTLIELEQRVDGEDVKPAILRAMRDGRLSVKTGQQMLDKNRRLAGDERPTSLWKAGREYIKTKLSSEGITFSSEQVAGQVRARQAEALEEFDVYIENNPNAPPSDVREFYHKLTDRATANVLRESELSLVAPRSIPKRSEITLKSLKAAEERVLADLDAGRMTKDEADVELRRLADWKELRTLQEEATKK